MLLLLDFDGTLTDVDTLDLLVAEHAPAIWLEAEQALTTGSMTLNEVIAFASSTRGDVTARYTWARRRSRPTSRSGRPHAVAR